MTIVFIFDVVILAVQHIFTNIFAIASGIVVIPDFLVHDSWFDRVKVSLHLSKKNVIVKTF